MYGHLLCGQGFLQCRVLPTEKLVSEIPLHAFDIPNNFETTIDIIDEKIVELKNYKKEFTISLLLISASVLIATFYQSSGSQILQLSSFLLSLFFASNVLQRWIKLDSN